MVDHLVDTLENNAASVDRCRLTSYTSVILIASNGCRLLYYLAALVFGSTYALCEPKAKAVSNPAGRSDRGSRNTVDPLGPRTQGPVAANNASAMDPRHPRLGGGGR